MARPAKTTVADAIKTEAPSAQTVNVPVRLDASALTKALQAAAEQTAARVNAGELIKNSAIKIEEIYKRFDALKLLANELNGKPLSDPLPSTVQLDEISFRFRIAKAENVSEMTTATVKTVVCVGDIASQNLSVHHKRICASRFQHQKTFCMIFGINFFKVDVGRLHMLAQMLH